MKILLEKKVSYGHERIYPACETSKSISELMKRDCFNDKALSILKRLGYKIEYKKDESNG